jgi:hypothetical protein
MEKAMNSDEISVISRFQPGSPSEQAGAILGIHCGAAAPAESFTLSFPSHRDTPLAPLLLSLQP